MHEVVSNVIQRYYEVEPIDIHPLGGGFYGKVFLATLDKAPFKVVVKIYLKLGLAQNEGLQIVTLNKYGHIPMPKVYQVHQADQALGYDVLMMEYLEGVNAGIQPSVNEEALDYIAEKIIDNLIAYHSVSNTQGFGELSATEFVKDWRQYYKPIVDRIFSAAQSFYSKKILSKENFQIIEQAYNNFEHIFYLPVTTSSLIHGDYNTWNIMLNEELTDVRAVIDPFGCCWGDAEYDLYQLNNANGRYFSLLERYKKKCSVSENFEIKLCFYELFTELMHYHDAGVKLRDADIAVTALKLKEQMNNI